MPEIDFFLRSFLFHSQQWIMFWRHLSFSLRAITIVITIFIIQSGTKELYADHQAKSMSLKKNCLRQKNFPHSVERTIEKKRNKTMQSLFLSQLVYASQEKRKIGQKFQFPSHLSPSLMIFTSIWNIYSIHIILVILFSLFRFFL